MSISPNTILSPEEIRVGMIRQQRALTRNKNVNRHIMIANAIVRKANGRPIMGRKLEEWRAHTQKADTLIKRYESDPILKTTL